MRVAAANPSESRRSGARFDLFRRFRRDERGANAVEFGIVSLPFFAVLLAIIEASLVFITNQVMETSLRDSARLIRTGQAQMQGFSAAQFRDRVCTGITTMMNCRTDLLIDIRELRTFGNNAPPQPVRPDGTLDPARALFQTGQPGSIIIATAYYDAPSYANILGATMSQAPGNRIRLIATVTFRNEPFPVVQQAQP
jgi:Flp pilus assembly protein TadG